MDPTETLLMRFHQAQILEGMLISMKMKHGPTITEVSQLILSLSIALSLLASLKYCLA